MFFSVSYPSLPPKLRPASTLSFSSVVLVSSWDSAGHLFIVTLIYVLPKLIRCLIFLLCHCISKQCPDLAEVKKKVGLFIVWVYFLSLMNKY